METKNSINSGTRLHQRMRQNGMLLNPHEAILLLEVQIDQLTMRGSMVSPLNITPLFGEPNIPVG